MTNKQQLIAAITLFLSILWGMGYVLGQITRDHWAHFPVFTTTFLGMLCSAVWAISTIKGIIDEKRDK
jgi:hypothetical protein